MNGGNVLQTSSTQQMSTVNNSKSRWVPQQNKTLATQNEQHPPPHKLSWHDHNNQDFPKSLSQLLLNGLVGDEDDKSVMTQMQKVKKLENWEEQLLYLHHHCHRHQTSENGDSTTVKHETSPNGYGFVNDNNEFKGVKPTNCMDQMIGSSFSNYCVTGLTRNVVDFSASTNNKPDDRRHLPADHSSEARKEKLGDRVTALHQIVSPFGKTDTSSVLSEAMGYIRFLQAQIQALSLPYLGSRSPNTKHPRQSGQNSQEQPTKNLKSRGLCLVPVSCTMQVGSDTVADYWSPTNNLPR